MADSALYPDDVTLGDPASPVGLCTLWTRQARILRGVPRELYAVCGNLYSLWGISLLVRGVLARPTLRYLVLCGVDYAETGRALIALATHGLTPDGTLPGTDARLADDLDATALARFRQQVTVVDLRGCTDAARVAAAIRALPPPPPLPTDPPPILTPARASDVPLPGRSPSLTGGAGGVPLPGGVGGVPPVAPPSPPQSWGGRGGPQTFQPDPAGNFLIAVGDGQIVAAHATTTGGPTGHRFAGRTAAEIYRAILATALVSRLDHAAYLGAELARAEIALRLGIPYRQDRPLPLSR
jgi:tetrahydromethanopterin S-methyltransferase subunit A